MPRRSRAAAFTLRRLIEQLPEEQVLAALAAVQRVVPASQAQEWLPPWFGAIALARSNISERVDALLAEGFGR